MVRSICVALNMQFMSVADISLSMPFIIGNIFIFYVNVFSIMGIPRCEIVYKSSMAHATCRCHNQSFFLEDNKIKNVLMALWKKYKTKYGISIIEFVIMDNHYHLFVYVPNQQALSSFMQGVNSELARVINKHYGKTNQVFADRFCSPTIEDPAYFETVIQYIWNNPIKAGMLDAKHITKNPYSSLFYRIKDNDCDGLLISYEELRILVPDKVPSMLEGQMAYVKKLLSKLIDVVNNKVNSVKSLLANLLKNGKAIFEHAHTIGTDKQVKARRILLFRKHPPSLASP